MGQNIELGQFNLSDQHIHRFRLFSFENLFSEKSYRALQHSFNEVSWEKKETFFYTQFKSHILPAQKHAIASLFDPAFFFPFKAKLEQHVGVSFQNYIRIHAHKLITEDEIGVHNDYSDPEMGCENFRFVFQFSQPNQLSSGGEITFLSSRYKDDLIKQYSYGSNMGICFEITPYSFHYVTAVQGERHTLVMYLWEEGRKRNESGVEIL